MAVHEDDGFPQATHYQLQENITDWFDMLASMKSLQNKKAIQCTTEVALKCADMPPSPSVDLPVLGHFESSLSKGHREGTKIFGVII